MLTARCRAKNPLACRIHGNNNGLPVKGSTRFGLSEADAAEFDYEANHAQAWLSEAETKALRSYTHLNYLSVNKYLHNPAGYVGNVASVEKQVMLLDSALAKNVLTLVPRVLYRSVRLKHDDDRYFNAVETKAYVLEKHEVGKVLTFPAFSSTSMDSDYMLMHSRRHPQSSFVYEIVSDKGLAYSDSTEEKTGSNIQDFEHEVLLPRNMKFEVVSVQRATYAEANEDKFVSGSHFGRVKSKSSFNVVQLREIV